ncbi:MAG: radical SAM protein [Desulfovibrio sp.]|uniref:radical SAM protein n=1 Tax=Desulfovibrio sp. 7SRBS1 TaxID=3378064 RepID=UPI003B409810
MRILLIYPYFLFDRSCDENIRALPMGMHYIGASLLEAGHEVELADWHDLYKDPSIADKTLKRFRPDVVGVSIFHANRWGGIDIAGYIREKYPDLPIIFGGIGATFLDRLLLENFDCIDVIVRGEGEHTFTALVDALEQHRPLEEIPGLSLRKDNAYFATPDAEPICDLDSLPMPARHFSFSHLALTRGCPGKCSFCGSPKFWGPKVRFHSPEYFVTQMHLLYEKGVRHFFVSDDTFTLRKNTVLEICRRIREYRMDITWQAISRVDRLDDETAAAMRAAGCTQISFGVESGSPAIRRSMRKGFSNDDVRQAFAACMRNAILPRAYFIYGNPDENAETIEESAALIREIRPLISLFHVLSVFPGTSLWEDCKKKFNLTDQVWLERNEDMLYFECDPQMPPEQVTQWGQTLKKTFYNGLPEAVQELAPETTGQDTERFADFATRLAATFATGEYAADEHVKDAPALAEHLFRKALQHGNLPQAANGLGRLLGSSGRFREALETLSQGLADHPDSLDIALSLAAGLLSCNATEQARTVLEAFSQHAEAWPWLAQCCAMQGDTAGQAEYTRKIQAAG